MPAKILRKEAKDIKQIIEGSEPISERLQIIEGKYLELVIALYFYKYMYVCI